MIIKFFNTRTQKSDLRKAFTLIETIIYMAILVILLAVAINTLLSIIGVYKHFVVVSNIEDSAITTMERITRDIRNAESVSAGSSTFDTNPGTLTLSTLDSDGSPTTIQFAVISGAIHVTEGGTDLGPLTTGNTTITNLVFRYATTTRSELVKIELTLEAGSGDSQRIESFQTSTIVRGSYTN